MSKNFDEFLRLIDSKDWSLVAEQIASNVDSTEPISAIIKANLLAFTTVLREYHEWLHSEQ